eukprot:scaffold90010_cov71-Phaeocystis_antarctica.AAC.3
MRWAAALQLRACLTPQLHLWRLLQSLEILSLETGLPPEDRSHHSGWRVHGHLQHLVVERHAIERLPVAPVPQRQITKRLRTTDTLDTAASDS